MSDSHTQQGQVERAKRLRQQIENLKSGAASPAAPEQNKSLREQIEERAEQARESEKEKA